MTRGNFRVERRADMRLDDMWREVLADGTVTLSECGGADMRLDDMWREVLADGTVTLSECGGDRGVGGTWQLDRDSSCQIDT